MHTCMKYVCSLDKAVQDFSSSTFIVTALLPAVKKYHTYPHQFQQIHGKSSLLKLPYDCQTVL